MKVAYFETLIKKKVRIKTRNVVFRAEIICEYSRDSMDGAHKVEDVRKRQSLIALSDSHLDICCTYRHA